MTSIHIQGYSNIIELIIIHILTWNHWVRDYSRRNDGLNASPKMWGVTVSHIWTDAFVS